MSESDSSYVIAIDAVLPQTQCGQCGHGGCMPYAEAIARGEAAINRCPPGGQATIEALASLTGQSVITLAEDLSPSPPRHIARIDPAQCIGCTLCIQACPVDAIVGVPKHLHGVIAPLCTGCGLCVPLCPVDCISMELIPAWTAWTTADAEAARQRFQARKRRLQRREGLVAARKAKKAEAKLAALNLDVAAAELAVQPRETEALQRKQAVVAAALARARQRRLESKP